MQNFDDLDLNERAEIVWRGRFSERITYYNFHINLYILEDGRFAEVWFSPVENEIVEIKTADKEDMKKWVNRIKLTF